MTTEEPENYQTLSHLEQILLRPNMYIGSVENVIQEEYILSNNNRIIKSKTNFNEGLVRIFIEPLCNAIDNMHRGSNQTYIKVNITDDNKLEIENNGQGIPIEKKDGIYIPEIIFGRLLSSSNYDDSKERKGSGINGLGVKLSNIFSNNFEIKIVDIDRNLSYVQKWSNNMKNTNEPVIRKDNKAKKNNIVEIKITPDLNYFNLKSSDYKKLFPYMTKKVIDTAFICSSIKVYLNNEIIQIKTIEDYAKYYLDEISKDKISVITQNYEILIVANNFANDNCIVSFVNGIETPDGGCHIDAITNLLYEYYANKNKNQKFKWNDIKKFFHIFCKFEIDKPKFNSQLKSKLTAPKIKVDIPTQKLNKFEVSDIIKEYLEEKNDKKMKNELTRPRKQKIEGLDQANKAGSKESDKCVLIITEGLSAKTFACVGIKYGCFGVKGRDYFGIYPIRGKLLNVRNANRDQIQKNREINDIMQILNVKNGKSDYGKILLLTDSDVDGNHIEGLFINFIELLCPAMLTNIYTMRTPILKVPKGKSFHYFYDEYQANDYIQENNIKNAKYFKGLGSNNQDDIKDIFGKNVVQYSYDNEKDKDNLELAFSNKKNYSDKRKEWLGNYQRCYIDENNPLPVSSFINKEFIRFSIDDCDRSLPSVVDGFKTSQRKVFYGVIEKNLKYSGNTIKVAQLGALVAQITNYHHGETNLYETIIRMTHNHVGSNNIALLAQDGMMGTRLMGGKDAASPRYIFTKMNELTSLIFKREDEPLLMPEMDDGDEVEYSFYVPIIPMIVINGCVGIGTGWSTSIPCYDPAKIIELLLTKLSGKDANIELKPFYNGFQGEIKKISENKYECKGIIKKIKNLEYEISELPIDLWIDNFKEYLDDLVINKKIKNYVNHSTTETPSFKITINDDEVLMDINKKLTSTISTTNLVCLDINKKIKKYDSVLDIINEHYNIRLDYYERRRLHIINELIEKLCILNNKYRFLKCIIEDDIIIYKKPMKEVNKILEQHEFDLHPSDNNYNYLVDLQFRHATKEKLEDLRKLIDQAKKDLDYFKNITDKELWINELSILKNELTIKD